MKTRLICWSLVLASSLALTACNNNPDADDVTPSASATVMTPVAPPPATTAMMPPADMPPASGTAMMPPADMPPASGTAMMPATGTTVH